MRSGSVRGRVGALLLCTLLLLGADPAAAQSAGTFTIRSGEDGTVQIVWGQAAASELWPDDIDYTAGGVGSAEHPPVWSATLTVGDGDTGYIGCGDAAACERRLTEDSFTLGGRTCSLVGIRDHDGGESDGSLDVAFSAPENDAVKALMFCVGPAAFPMAALAAGTVRWAGAKLPWSVGGKVGLSIGRSCPPGKIADVDVILGSARLDTWWSPPPDTGGAPVADYEMRYS